MRYKRNINKQCRSYSEIWDFWSKKWVYVQIQICIWRRCTWTFGWHLNMHCCARGFFLVQISPVITPEGSQYALYVALLCRIPGSLRLKVLCELKLSSSFRNCPSKILFRWNLRPSCFKFSSCFMTTLTTIFKETYHTRGKIKLNCSALTLYYPVCPVKILQCNYNRLSAQHPCFLLKVV